MIAQRQSPRPMHLRGAAHTRPQTPQFERSVRLVSHVPSPSQSRFPVEMHRGVRPVGRSSVASVPASPPSTAPGPGLGSAPHATHTSPIKITVRMAETVRGTRPGCHAHAATGYRWPPLEITGGGHPWLASQASRSASVGYAAYVADELREQFSTVAMSLVDPQIGMRMCSQQRSKVARDASGNRSNADTVPAPHDHRLSSEHERTRMSAFGVFMAPTLPDSSAQGSPRLAPEAMMRCHIQRCEAASS